MSLQDRLDGTCKYFARNEVNRRINEMNMTQASASGSSGSVVVMSVQTTDGVVTLTVRTQDGSIITGVQPGSAPVGPGKTCILNAGGKLDG